MHTHAYKSKENKNQSVTNTVSQKQHNHSSTFQFIDNRPETMQMKVLQAMANNYVAKTIQKQGLEKEELLQGKFEPIQKKESPESGRRENNSGLPDNLKSGIENLSGYAMDEVKVHYNSDKPSQLQAHAYAQGTDIHLASGQEKHLPHEAWHVVQQKQGRVQPTMQMKGEININDDIGLEKEASPTPDNCSI